MGIKEGGWRGPSWADEGRGRKKGWMDVKEGVGRARESRVEEARREDRASRRRR